jgi:predicted lipoprotein with Yx(FWY)xxD motif
MQECEALGTGRMMIRSRGGNLVRRITVKTRPASVLSGLFMGWAVAVSGAWPQTGGVILQTAEHAEHGAYLTDGSGMSLYLFEEDRPEGERGRPVESDCVDDCLIRWPPLIVKAEPQVEGDAEASLIGSFKRPDGQTQATYNGWPLYYFAEDFLPGDTNGHDFEEFGGEWYLLTPAGHALGEDLDDDKRNREDNSGGG